jgi:hypothetical protein
MFSHALVKVILHKEWKRHECQVGSCKGDEARKQWGGAINIHSLALSPRIIGEPMKRLHEWMPTVVLPPVTSHGRIGAVTVSQLFLQSGHDASGA